MIHSVQQQIIWRREREREGESRMTVPSRTEKKLTGFKYIIERKIIEKYYKECLLKKRITQRVHLLFGEYLNDPKRMSCANQNRIYACLEDTFTNSRTKLCSNWQHDWFLSSQHLCHLVMDSHCYFFLFSLLFIYWFRSLIHSFDTDLFFSHTFLQWIRPTFWWNISFVKYT